LFGITKTCVEGEYGFGDVAYERTSFAEREEGKEFVGTHTALWGITAAVYLSLMGPQGIKELGEHLLWKSRYAMSKLSEIEGIEAPFFKSPHFKEFVVSFRGTGKSVAEINKALRERKIFGGKDLSKESQELNNCALYCVTEIHSREDIDTLVKALKESLK